MDECDENCQFQLWEHVQIIKDTNTRARTASKHMTGRKQNKRRRRERGERNGSADLGVARDQRGGGEDEEPLDLLQHRLQDVLVRPKGVDHVAKDNRKERLKQNAWWWWRWGSGGSRRRGGKTRNKKRKQDKKTREKKATHTWSTP